MGEIAISVNSVSKSYFNWSKPSDRLKQLFFPNKYKGEKFDALKNISFELYKGDSLGIVGRNGAGKSTLLQILTGVLMPTSGKIEVNGRVGALLELGSGFNGEYTGIENIYMNASVLGMTRKETDQKLQSIIDFAELGDFIEKPIKTYSSGMSMRLAFAVQAQLEPDILIVDEALSVGDDLFQHKCMRYMTQMLKNSKVTVIFVSHGIDSIKKLCRKGMWLDRGTIGYFGNSNKAVEKYYQYLTSLNAKIEPDILEKDFESIVYEADYPEINGFELELENNIIFSKNLWKLIEHKTRKVRIPKNSNWKLSFQFWGNHMILEVSGSENNSIDIIVDGVVRTIVLVSEIRKYQFDFENKAHKIILQGSSNDFKIYGAKLYSKQKPTYSENSNYLIGSKKFKRYGSGNIIIVDVELLDFKENKDKESHKFDDIVKLRICAKKLKPIKHRIEASFIVRDINQIDLFGTNTREENVFVDSSNSFYVFDFSFRLRMRPGIFSIHSAIVECDDSFNYKNPCDVIEIAKSFRVQHTSHPKVWYTYYESTLCEINCIK